MGKKFLTTDQQEEIGILSPEVRARLAASYNALENAPPAAAAVEPATPGQTALFNHWEDAQECARCGGRMVRTGSCYTCTDCGTNTGCSYLARRRISGILVGGGVTVAPRPSPWPGALPRA
jgi:ribonucleoside-diphosphate reductase alpha chain